jgi:hypothetical protein
MADQQKRGTPTIDLTATEVELTAGAKASAAETQSGPSPHESAADATSDLPPPQQPRVSDATRRPRGASLRVTAIVAGFAGAALAMALVAAAWFAGMVPQPSAMPDRQIDEIAALRKQVQDLQSRPAIPADNQAVGALQQSVRKLEADIAKLPPGDKTVAERVSAADNAMKSLGVALTALAKRSDDIAAKSDQAQASATAAEKAVNDLRASMQSVKQQASAAVDPGALASVQKRVDALGQSLAAAREQIDKTTAVAKGAQEALNAAALRDAVESGGPYQSELAQARALGADSLVEPLERFSTTGVPTREALAHKLKALIPALVKAIGDQAAPGGFLERLQANAEKLVSVRPVGVPSGDDVTAVLARIEVEAARADIDGALADIGKLPPSVRQPAAGWIAEATARQQALAAVRRYASNATKALGSGADGKP